MNITTSFSQPYNTAEVSIIPKRPIYADMSPLSQARAIAENAGFTLERVQGPSSRRDLYQVRRKIVLALADRGLKFKPIAKIAGRSEHTCRSYLR